MTPPIHTDYFGNDTTCLLCSPLNDFLLYSGHEMFQWLIDISHESYDICETVTRLWSTVLSRYGLETWGLWRNVDLSDPLIPSSYLYAVLDHVIVSLLKIIKCTGKSKTSASGNASTMANWVKQCDKQCWVTGSTFPTINSHVCPKQLGDHLLRIIYSPFVSIPPTSLSVYHEMCGISLIPGVDTLFDMYLLGLQFVALVHGLFFLQFYNFWFINLG